MRTRNMLATVLALLVFVVPSLTAGCDLSCELPQIHSACCHFSETSSSAGESSASMPAAMRMGRSHCEQRKSDGTTMDISAITTKFVHAGTAAICSHATIWTVPESATVLAQLSSLQWTIAETTVIVWRNTNSQGIQSETPPLLASIDPLAVLLRI